MLPHSPLIPTKFLVISIHAPKRGATRVVACKTYDRRYFNPRFHEGSDRNDTSQIFDSHDFNPRSHEGSDHSLSVKYAGQYDFNPRSHEGSDLHQAFTQFIEKNFNPRSHEGSDGIYVDCGLLPKISIHAPTRGATATLTNFFFYNQSIFC